MVLLMELVALPLSTWNMHDSDVQRLVTCQPSSPNVANDWLSSQPPNALLGGSRDTG